MRNRTECGPERCPGAGVVKVDADFVCSGNVNSQHSETSEPSKLRTPLHQYMFKKSACTCRDSGEGGVGEDSRTDHVDTLLGTI